MRQALAQAITRLPDRERLVVTLYYYEELTLREIGEVLSVTESRVSQLHTKAILRLRVRLQGSLDHAAWSRRAPARSARRGSRRCSSRRRSAPSPRARDRGDAVCVDRALRALVALAVAGCVRLVPVAPRPARAQRPLRSLAAATPAAR